MSDPLVQLDNVWFEYEANGFRTPALKDVSFSVHECEFVGVVGPNGGGKTTLLKIILGLETPQRGSVRVLGRRPSDVRARIGYVPQHAAVDHTVPASVLDVALTGRLAQSRWGAWFGQRDVDAAKAALRLTSTEDLANRPIGTLSGGQRQRVLIARALAGDVGLLLLDEPTSGVDVHMERGLIELLHDLNKRLPIVMISHDISFVSSHLDRVACLNRTLTYHEAHEVTEETVASMYHGHVVAVEHGDACSHGHEELPD